MGRWAGSVIDVCLRPPYTKAFVLCFQLGIFPKNEMVFLCGQIWKVRTIGHSFWYGTKNGEENQ